MGYLVTNQELSQTVKLYEIFNVHTWNVAQRVPVAPNSAQHLLLQSSFLPFLIWYLTVVLT